MTAVGTPPPAPSAGPAHEPGRRWGFDRRRLRLGLVIGVIAGALAFLLLQGLDNATLYFRNADEAVAMRDELGDRRFRLQGTVLAGSVTRLGDDGLEFRVTYDGVEVPVRHRGEQPALFRPGIPVVLEGHFPEGGDVYESDRIMVRHTSEYREEHPDRVADAPSGGS
jgi:cytochrome c-type biogenesis protein CcmE